MNLTAVMGLVVEEMRDEEPDRPGQLPAGAAGEPGEITGQPVRIEAVGPGLDQLVERRAFALEVSYNFV